MKGNKQVTIYKNIFEKNFCKALALKIAEFLESPVFLKIDFSINIYITGAPTIGFFIISMFMFLWGNTLLGFIFLLLSSVFLPIFIGFLMTDYRKKGRKKFPIKY